MNRLYLVAVVAAFAADGAGAMHTPMMSTQYFPLIDGARYEYVFTSGPRASAVAVMHSGQTWAGAAQLTSFHTTATCRPSTPCVQDTTDFFRMDPDGMRYFGGDGRTADHVNYMTTLMNPEWLIKIRFTRHDDGPGDGVPGRRRLAGNRVGMHSVMGQQRHTSTYQALALETVTTPAGTFAIPSTSASSAGPALCGMSGTPRASAWCAGSKVPRKHCSRISCNLPGRWRRSHERWSTTTQGSITTS